MTLTRLSDTERDEALKGDSGAGPFVTLRHLTLADGSLIWRARHHRKGLGTQHSGGSVWQSRGINILMALGFAVGALLFVAGAVLSLWPGLTKALALSEYEANFIYFAGSLFFTAAAYLQLLQAANAPPWPGAAGGQSHITLLGWRPDDPGWLASAVQFAGTLLFNANTYDAMHGGGGGLGQDLTIWGPDIVGSALFLIAGYLALIETCHSCWAWRPRELAWWIVMVNFLGCIAFMASACLAFVPPGGIVASIVIISTGFTLVGSLGFLTGALLSVPESTMN